MKDIPVYEVGVMTADGSKMYVLTKTPTHTVRLETTTVGSKGYVQQIYPNAPIGYLTVAPTKTKSPSKESED